jgi:hypothetical protein
MCMDVDTISSFLSLVDVGAWGQEAKVVWELD